MIEGEYSREYLKSLTDEELEDHLEGLQEAVAILTPVGMVSKEYNLMLDAIQSELLERHLLT